MLMLISVRIVTVGSVPVAPGMNSVPIFSVTAPGDSGERLSSLLMGTEAQKHTSPDAIFFYDRL